MEKFLGMSEAKSVTKGLATKRIIFDKACVMRSYKLIKELGTPFKENNRLIQLSSRMECNEEIKCDMINAERKGEESLRNFITNRIESKTSQL